MTNPVIRSNVASTSAAFPVKHITVVNKNNTKQREELKWTDVLDVLQFWSYETVLTGINTIFKNKL